MDREAIERFIELDRQRRLKAAQEKGELISLINSDQLQSMILDCITSEEVDKFFNATIFADNPENQACKQAMIHGMIIASMMTSNCERFYTIR